MKYGQGLKIMWVTLIICEWEKYPLAKRLPVRIIHVPKQTEKISDLTSLLVEKILTSKTLQVH